LVAVKDTKLTDPLYQLPGLKLRLLLILLFTQTILFLLHSPFFILLHLQKHRSSLPDIFPPKISTDITHWSVFWRALAKTHLKRVFTETWKQSGSANKQGN